MVGRTVYERYGYEDREEYLESLAGEMNVDPQMVFAAADVLGEDEDFDGLVMLLQDFGIYF